MTWYEAAIHVRPVKQSPNWVQERARFRLAVLHMQLDQHKDALNYFKQFEPLLEQMNHHSPETRQHARIIRYHLGKFTLLYISFFILLMITCAFRLSITSWQ